MRHLFLGLKNLNLKLQGALIAVGIFRRKITSDEILGTSSLKIQPSFNYLMLQLYMSTFWPPPPQEYRYYIEKVKPMDSGNWSSETDHTTLNVCFEHWDFLWSTLWRKKSSLLKFWELQIIHYRVKNIK